MMSVINHLAKSMGIGEWMDRHKYKEALEVPVVSKRKSAPASTHFPPLSPPATKEVVYVPVNDGWKSEINKTMKIVLEPIVQAKLALMDKHSNKMEFSGYGYVEMKGNEMIVYDIVLMDIGTYGWTQFEPSKILKLLDREDASKMKLWFHRHPLGNGVPGSHNWSGTDDNTCKFEPLGGIPELIKWCAAIVKTPHGWVGRIDNHGTKKTLHVNVGFAGMEDTLAAIAEIKKEKAAITAATFQPTKIGSGTSTLLPPTNWKKAQKAFPLRQEMEGEYDSLFDMEEYWDADYDRDMIFDEPDFDSEDPRSYVRDSFYEMMDDITLQMEGFNEAIMEILTGTTTINTSPDYNESGYKLHLAVMATQLKNATENLTGQWTDVDEFKNDFYNTLRGHEKRIRRFFPKEKK